MRIIMTMMMMKIIIMLLLLMMMIRSRSGRRTEEVDYNEKQRFIISSKFCDVVLKHKSR